MFVYMFCLVSLPMLTSLLVGVNLVCTIQFSLAPSVLPLPPSLSPCLPPSPLLPRGLHWLAKRVRERLCHIAEELQAYDIVGLQEVGEKQH